MRSVLVFFLSLGLTVGTTASAADYDLPSIGQPADTVMSPAEEDRIGRQVVSQLLKNGAILDDPEISAYLRSVGTRLALQTRSQPDDFEFFLINSQQVNAFALPGGYIGMNAGLIMESETESEMAGVMAHEIAHVTQRHIARQIQSTQGMSIATAAAMLLAIIAGGGNPAVVQAAITMGISGLGQQQINFTRAHELEADRLGIRTLAGAGYNPNGMSGFFEKMERRSRLYGNQLPEILLTHPISTTRIAEARSRAREYGSSHIEESERYRLMRARARVLSSSQPTDSLTYFREQRKGSQAHPADDYGYALALSRVGRSEAARDILAELTEQTGAAHPHFALALAQTQFETGADDAGLATLDQLRREYSSYRPVILAYSEALLRTNQPAETRAYLLDQSRMLNRDPHLHQLLARAADQMDQPEEAYYQEAEAHRLRGEYGAAIFKLRSALELPDLSSQAESRIQAALTRYRQQCDRLWSESECRKRIEGVVGRRDW
ncbi:MAG: M48 family metalloprotease [Salinisphaeraceae bacterium]